MNFSTTMNLLARDKRVFSEDERSGTNNKRVIPINPARTRYNELSNDLYLRWDNKYP